MSNMKRITGIIAYLGAIILYGYYIVGWFWFHPELTLPENFWQNWPILLSGFVLHWIGNVITIRTQQK